MEKLTFPEMMDRFNGQLEMQRSTNSVLTEQLHVMGVMKNEISDDAPDIKKGEPIHAGFMPAFNEALRKHETECMRTKHLVSLLQNVL